MKKTSLIYEKVEEIINLGYDELWSSPSLLEPTETSKNQPFFLDHRASVYLYQANCLEFMDRILAKHPDGLFDMIFADPPYFLSNGGITCHAGQMVRVNKGEWDRSQGAALNHEFNRAWLGRCQRLLRPNGTIWVSGTLHAIFSTGFAMQELGFKVLNDIAWEKPNPPPNLTCRYFTHSVETIIWAAKNEKSKHVFNYQAMKAENEGKQMKTVWRMAPPFAEEKAFGKHPTQKPIQLVSRCIRASTKAGDFVFDPFVGSGTTGVASISLDRRFCGIEAELEFVSLAAKRLAHQIEKIARTTEYT